MAGRSRRRLLVSLGIVVAVTGISLVWVGHWFSRPEYEMTITYEFSLTGDPPEFYRVLIPRPSGWDQIGNDGVVLTGNASLTSMVVDGKPMLQVETRGGVHFKAQLRTTDDSTSFGQARANNGTMRIWKDEVSSPLDFSIRSIEDYEYRTGEGNLRIITGSSILKGGWQWVTVEYSTS